MRPLAVLFYGSWHKFELAGVEKKSTILNIDGI
jgi:hypothetical protein